MAAQILPPTTAGIHPEKFNDDLVFAADRRYAWVVLAILLALAFGLRVTNLGSESLGEDELNKLQTVEEYRTNGISGKNGEHPFLMKGLQTVSIVAAERLNTSVLPADSPISDEAAIRFPIVLFGSFSVLLIFLLVSELFGRSIGLISAALWAVEPMAIGFDRVAKEDSLVLFFFLLTNLFWIRSQTEAEVKNEKWRRYAWLAAASFGALMASKYYPFFLAVTGAYYIIYRNVPNRYWDMKGVPWIKFLTIMAVSFVILNPTILLPETWRDMLNFSSEKRIGHDSYEFLGELYRNQMSAFLNGVPWTFYFVFGAVKTSLSTLILFAIGLPLIWKRKLGDGRFFVFLWGVLWLIMFTFIGGKFTRYFTNAAPLIFIGAAEGFYFVAQWLSGFTSNKMVSAAIQILLFVGLIAVPLSNSLSAGPHFRLFTNTIGGGISAAGTYFPHDEFCDLSTKEIVAEIVRSARPNAVIACETPALFEHYAQKAGRADVKIVSLSDKDSVTGLAAGDFVVVAGGRRYKSNTAYIELLSTSGPKPIEVKAGETVSARIYALDQSTADALRAIAAR
ncbi:MAG: glycosyltransferase family 39 protein [Acidobacteria bacterium]|nr:glycosyltransferase family 39 protein [Acidobacteriota bacterium]